MSDAGEQLIAEVGAALLESTGVAARWDAVTISCPEGLAAFVAALERRFVMIPRAEVEIAEYGWQQRPGTVEINGGSITELANYVHKSMGRSGGTFYEYLRVRVPVPAPELVFEEEGSTDAG